MKSEDKPDFDRVFSIILKLIGFIFLMYLLGW